MTPSAPPGISAAATSRMAAAVALFATADDGDWRDQGWLPVGPDEPPCWLDANDGSDPLEGLTEDQARLVIEGPQALGAGFSHRADAARAAATGRSGGGFAAGGPLDVMEPGHSLAWFADSAYTAGLRRLCDDELVGFTGAARRQQARGAAMELAAVAELDRRRTAGKRESSHDSEHVSSELAAAMALTGRAADSLLGLARGLARLPEVLAALHAGKIDLPRARAFIEELAMLADDTARDIAREVLAAAADLTTSKLRNLLRRLILLTDAGALRERAEAARKDARVESFAEGSGNRALAGRELPAAEVIAASARITAIAYALKDAGAADPIDQLRAKVFLALLSGTDPASLIQRPEADPSALSGSVNLVVPMSTWLSQSDAPGEAAGHGTIDADTCRDLAGRLAAAGSAARWCLTVTDSGGRAVAHGCAARAPRPGDEASWAASLRLSIFESGTCKHPRLTATYRPGSLLDHVIRVRQRTCSFPGCGRPAARCDADHTVPYDRGGLTCECNLSPLCRRHHRAKQASGWHLKQPQPGVLVWTLPCGRTRTVSPEPYPAA